MEGVLRRGILASVACGAGREVLEVIARLDGFYPRMWKENALVGLAVSIALHLVQCWMS